MGKNDLSMNNTNNIRRALSVIEVVLEERELTEDEKLLTIPIERFDMPKILLYKILHKLEQAEILDLPDMAHKLSEDCKKDPDLDFDINYRDYVNNFILVKPDYKKIIEYRHFILKRSKKENSINRLPKIENLTWEDITMKFVDGHNVKIKIRDQVFDRNYKEMGFEDSRAKKPDDQWKLLKIFAKNNGSISWDSTEATKQIKKRKQLLSDGLKNFFRIDDKPFYKYTKNTGYEIKISCIPESGSYLENPIKKNLKDGSSEDDLLGIDEYLNEVAPIINR